MPIPDFQATFLPLLELLKNGNEMSNQDIYDHLEKHFNITNEERNALLPSGKQKIFTNRVAWGKSYLKQAGLIQSKERGFYSITTRGLSELSLSNHSISVKSLMKYEEFKKFRCKRQDNSTHFTKDRTKATNLSLSPQDQIESGYKQIIEGLSAELISKIMESSPRFFEQLVIDLLLAMGYGGHQRIAHVTKQGPDEGIDGIIHEDKLGLEIIYIQAKRWEKTIGRPEIQRFAGALHGQKARKGIFITTSSFTHDAIEYIKSIETRIALIDASLLTKLMIEYNIGVEPHEVYEVKRLNIDYFIGE